jgi:hypothetical protein
VSRCASLFLLFCLYRLTREWQVTYREEGAPATTTLSFMRGPDIDADRDGGRVVCPSRLSCLSSLSSCL